MSALKEFRSILASTCRVVLCVIPPLLRLGWIDHSGSVVLGAVIGIGIAIWSMSVESDPLRGEA